MKPSFEARGTKHEYDTERKSPVGFGLRKGVNIRAETPSDAPAGPLTGTLTGVAKNEGGVAWHGKVKLLQPCTMYSNTNLCESCSAPPMIKGLFRLNCRLFIP
jgi:hypothetical protein